MSLYPTGTYRERITCWNCSLTATHDIPKGTPIEAFKERTVCARCGCGLSNASRSFRLRNERWMLEWKRASA